jgi:formylglycine-generating enzyme required for sulfatase activity
VPGLALSLPTEAQWEYACRAGTTTPFSFGEGITPEQVNYDGNFPYANGWKGLDTTKRTGLNRRETATVRSLPPNPWGFYEMHGNVWEWCLDGYRRYNAVVVHYPVGSAEPGGDRMIRGGSWSSHASGVRCASRDSADPGYRGVSVGFRCARAQQGLETLQGPATGPASPAPTHAKKRRWWSRLKPWGGKPEPD